jgi:hypothetical protein
MWQLAASAAAQAAAAAARGSEDCSAAKRTPPPPPPPPPPPLSPHSAASLSCVTALQVSPVFHSCFLFRNFELIPPNPPSLRLLLHCLQTLAREKFQRRRRASYDGMKKCSSRVTPLLLLLLLPPPPPPPRAERHVHSAATMTLPLSSKLYCWKTVTTY